MPTLVPKWNQMNIAYMPPPHFGSALAYKRSSGTAFIFGGTNSTSGYLNDTWSFNGSQWQQVQTTHRPSPRYGMVMAWNNVLQKATLFGGIQNRILLGETWSFNGVDWSQLNPIQHPSPRTGACIAYDTDHNQIILFGGLADTGGRFLELLNDMWVWNGTNWQQQLPANLPTARVGANMVYDNYRHVMLLFGGGVGGGLLDDTWTWNGTNWTKQQPVHIPSLRADFGMTYDEDKQRVVIFGGQSIANNPPTDTWVWLGNDWCQLQTIVQPPNQLAYRARIFYISLLKTVILFNDFRQKNSDPNENVTMTEQSEVWKLDYVRN